MIAGAFGWHGAEFGKEAKQQHKQRTSLQVSLLPGPAPLLSLDGSESPGSA